MPDGDDEPRGRAGKAGAIHTATIVAGISAEIALLRGSGRTAAAILADCVTALFPKVIELATGAINEPGGHYGEKAIIEEQRKLLQQAYAKTLCYSVREFREIFKTYRDGDWKTDRVSLDPTKPTPNNPPRYTENDPEFFFYQALCLIDRLPAESTLYTILRATPIRR